MLKLKQILLEQSDTLSIIKQAIINKLPLTIYYASDSNDVLDGERIETEPIILGTHSQSGNLVFWAYVTKGVSLRGIPNWKMFRVDRVKRANIDPNSEPFDLDSLPDYDKYKSPNNLETIDNVLVYSPYTEKGKPIEKQPTQKEPIEKPSVQEPPVEKPSPEIPTEPLPTEKDVILKPKTDEPEIENKKILEPIQNKQTNEPLVNPEVQPLNLEKEIEDVINKTHKIVNNKKFISNLDFKNLQNTVYSKLENEWKEYQRKVGKNTKPGEGTRNRLIYFANKQILDKLKSTNTTIDDKNTLNEIYQIIKRFKLLI